MISSKYLTKYPKLGSAAPECQDSFQGKQHE